MSGLRLSVVVASFGRPDALKRCLLALSQQVTAGLEVVVVADSEGQAAARHLPVSGALKLLPQRTANISAARNAGIRAAAGEIVAFLDDDAVPEPTWANAILTAFAGAEDLGAATGPVLGRNGISLQWGPLAVDGQARDLPIDPNGLIRDGFARKLQGTNMAVRRSVLRHMNGFDEAFTFFLDDTDLSLRLWRSGIRSLWLKAAVVHHGYAASSRRTEDRVPLTLYDIGASSAVYLRKHAPAADYSDALRNLEIGQSTRLLRLAKSRKIDADQMRALMNTLKAGITDGQMRDSVTGDIGPDPDDFGPFQARDPLPHRVLSGRSFRLTSLRDQARDLVAQGHSVTIFAFEPTPRKHKVRFVDGGWWEQTGGLFGPSDRSGPRIQFGSYKKRLTLETRRISATRGL